jgi:hypothetical protein
MAKMDENAVCESLQTDIRYRFLAKKEIGAMEAHAYNICNIRSYKEIGLLGNIAASVP